MPCTPVFDASHPLLQSSGVAGRLEQLVVADKHLLDDEREDEIEAEEGGVGSQGKDMVAVARFELATGHANEGAS